MNSRCLGLKPATFVRLNWLKMFWQGVIRILVHQVSDWCSGAAAYFGWMREAKRENTRCGL
jgi:hypothetical protein